MSGIHVTVDTHTNTHNNKSDRSSDYSGEIVSPREATEQEAEGAGSASLSDSEWVLPDYPDIGPDDSASISRQSARQKPARRVSRTQKHPESSTASQHSIPRAPSHRGRHEAGSVVFAPEVEEPTQDYGHYNHGAQVYSRAASVMSHYPDPTGVHPNPFAAVVNPDSVVPYGHPAAYGYGGGPVPTAPGYYHPSQQQQHRMSAHYGPPQDQLMYGQPPAGYPFPPAFFPPQYIPVMAPPGQYPASNTTSTSTPKASTPSPATAPAVPVGPSVGELALKALQAKFDLLKAEKDAQEAALKKEAEEKRLAEDRAALESRYKKEMAKALEKAEKESKEKSEELEKKLGKEKETAIEAAVKEAGKPKVEAKAPIKFKDAVGRK